MHIHLQASIAVGIAFFLIFADAVADPVASELQALCSHLSESEDCEFELDEMLAHAALIEDLSFRVVSRLVTAETANWTALDASIPSAARGEPFDSISFGRGWSIDSPRVRLTVEHMGRDASRVALLQVETPSLAIRNNGSMHVFLWNGALQVADLVSALPDFCLELVHFWAFEWEQDSPWPDIILTSGPDRSAGWLRLIRLSWDAADGDYKVSWLRYFDRELVNSVSFEDQQFQLWGRDGESVGIWTLERDNLPPGSHAWAEGPPRVRSCMVMTLPFNTLAEDGYTLSEESLARALEDESWSTRFNAANAAGKYNIVALRPQLMKLLHKVPESIGDKTVMEFVLSALCSMGGGTPEETKRLFAMLTQNTGEMSSSLLFHAAVNLEKQYGLLIHDDLACWAKVTSDRYAREDILNHLLRCPLQPLSPDGLVALIEPLLADPSFAVWLTSKVGTDGEPPQGISEDVCVRVRALLAERSSQSTP